MKEGVVVGITGTGAGIDAGIGAGVTTGAGAAIYDGAAWVETTGTGRYTGAGNGV